MPTISFTVTATEAGRIQKAVGHILNLGRDATGEETRQFIIAKIKNIVKEDEREVYITAHTETPIEPT